jgi:large subunit ribosomal protein L10
VLRAQKEELVEQLHQTFADAELVVVTHQSGLTVAEANDLRRRMREAEASYRVTKNRLAKIAIQGTRYACLEALFTGPTAIAFSHDPIAAAKVAVEFANKNDKLRIVGGAMGEKELDVAAVGDLARLPSLDQLRGQLVGLLQTPASRLVGVLQAPGGQLARVLAAYAKKDADA